MANKHLNKRAILEAKIWLNCHVIKNGYLNNKFETFVSLQFQRLKWFSSCNFSLIFKGNKIFVFVATTQSSVSFNDLTQVSFY